jgi:hypothetical protein
MRGGGVDGIGRSDVMPPIEVSVFFAVRKSFVTSTLHSRKWEEITKWTKD